MSKNLQLTSPYYNNGKPFDVWPELHEYVNGGLEIELYCNGDPDFPDYIECWTVLTVWLRPTSGNRAYVDTNNNGESIRNWIEKNRLGKPTGRLECSGFCVYPEYEFDLERLKSFEYKG